MLANGPPWLRTWSKFTTCPDAGTSKGVNSDCVAVTVISGNMRPCADAGGKKAMLAAKMKITGAKRERQQAASNKDTALALLGKRVRNHIVTGFGMGGTMTTCHDQEILATI